MELAEGVLLVPFFLLKNDDFLLKNDDFLLKNVDLATKGHEYKGGQPLRQAVSLQTPTFDTVFN